MYISHIEENGNRVQSVAEHSDHTAKLAIDRCCIEELKSSIYLACKLHDSGKNTPEFLAYIKKAHEDPSSVRRGEVIHSAAGGCLITEAAGEMSGIRAFMAELIREAIISHHGIYDCVTPDGTVSYHKRAEKENQIDAIRNEVYTYLSKEEMEQNIQQACRELNVHLNHIGMFVKNGNGRLGNGFFYVGMSERMLLSLLIDSDRTDTACFMSDRPLPEAPDKKALLHMWHGFRVHLEEKVNALEVKTPIDIYRQEISQACCNAGDKPSGIFRLVVPTGAEKTISSLRYALKHAEQFGKNHIVYIAPYNSILEQNAKVIRDMIGNGEAVLEHHCNIVPDEDGDDGRYKELTANWDSPVIVTTAVQFLNTLFSDKTSSVRRMHTLADSVIILDEIQFIPVKCISLFNLAMNYLKEICKSSVILCSATQPLFDRLDKNSLIEPPNMIMDSEKYSGFFKRTQIHDQTDFKPGGFQIRELADYIYKKLADTQSILVIVNTKSCAKNLYSQLKEITSDLNEESKPLLFHLSTDMCARHRKKTLDQVIQNLRKRNRKIICVSTQLIEAGVDISFQTVIRSLAGLDNIVQAAGRCNRNRELECGDVFIVRIADENVSRLADIKMAQDAMNSVLHMYRTSPELLDCSLQSKKAMDRYYAQYFMSRKPEMDYKIPELDMTIVDLLSENRKSFNNLIRKENGQKTNLALKQAFKTAGEYFEVITDRGMTDIVVECDRRSKRLISEMNSKLAFEQQKQCLRQLQIYSVSISKIMKDKLNAQNALIPLHNAGITVLRKEFYSKETGVTESPSEMDPYFS